MNKNQIVQFLKILGARNIDTTTRSGWVLCACMFARWKHEGGTSTDSFGIKIGNKTFCNCFACDTHGDPEDILFELTIRCRKYPKALERIKAARYYLETDGKNQLVLGKGAYEEESNVDQVIPFPEWVVSGFPTAYDHPYLATRKGGPIPKAVGELMDFRFDWKRERLGVPIRDFEGVLVGFHGRTVADLEPTYLAYRHADHWNRPVWSGENRLDLSKPVLMVESIFDEARAAQIYRNVCSPLSASLNEAKIARMSSALHIVEMFDNDKAGALASKKLAKNLPDSSIQRVPPMEDFGDVGATPIDYLAEQLDGLLELDPILS